MSLEEYLELRREARLFGWNIDVLGMFLTMYHLHNRRDATLEEVREFFRQGGTKKQEEAAE